MVTKVILIIKWHPNSHKTLHVSNS